jgi:hypothetical protein
MKSNERKRDIGNCEVVEMKPRGGVGLFGEEVVVVVDEGGR